MINLSECFLRLSWSFWFPDPSSSEDHDPPYVFSASSRIPSSVKTTNEAYSLQDLSGSPAMQASFAPVPDRAETSLNPTPKTVMVPDDYDREIMSERRNIASIGNSTTPQRPSLSQYLSTRRGPRRSVRFEPLAPDLFARYERIYSYVGVLYEHSR